MTPVHLAQMNALEEDDTETGEIALRSRANALKIRQTTELHCEGKPFEVNTPMKSLLSSALESDEATKDILQFTEKSLKCFE